MTLTADKVDGIGVTRIVTLQQFLGELRTAAAVACGAAIAAHPLSALADPVAGRASPVVATSNAEPFWRVVVGQLKHTLENIGSLGEGRATSGAVFVAELEGGRLTGAPHRVSSRSDLSWPVVGSDGEVYALDGDQLARLTALGASEAVSGQVGPWRKLVGVGPDGVVVGVLAQPPPFGGRPCSTRTESLRSARRP